MAISSPLHIPKWETKSLSCFPPCLEQVEFALLLSGALPSYLNLLLASQKRTCKSEPHVYPSLTSIPSEMDFEDPSRDASRPFLAFLVVLGLVLLFGGFWTIAAEKTFFQKPIQDTVAPTLQVGCVTWKGNESSYLLENTEQLAKDGSKIILWSEAAIEWLDDHDVHLLHRKVSALALKYEVFIGMASPPPLSTETRLTPFRRCHIYKIY